MVGLTPRTSRDDAADSEPGPPPSFRELYEEHFDFVWRYVAHHRVPEALLEDVVQEVFVVVHRRLASFEGRSSIKTWIVGIARNVLRDYLRKRKYQPAGDELGEADAVDPRHSAADWLELKSAANLLDRVLESMSDVQREVFLLCELEQLSSVEVAELLSENENTVRTRLRAARQIFKAGVARFKAQQAWRDA